MKRRHFCLYACLICYLTLAAPCLAQMQPVTTEWKQTDARLSKTVTVWQSHIRMAEVLMAMKEQTGVAVSVPHDAAFSGMELCVFIKDKPLSEVMNALWSFLSVRRHAYRWERQGKSDYHYTLLETSASKQFSKDLLVALQADYESHTALLCRMADYDKEGRQKFRNEFIASMHCEADTGEADIILGYEMLWDKIRLFKQVLTLAQQKTVLRREGTVTVSVDSLATETKTLLRQSMHTDEHLEKIFGSPKESNAVVIFSTNFEVVDESRLIPNLFCGVRIANYKLMSGVESGHCRENGLRNYIAGQWLLSQDQSMTSKKSETVVSLSQPANDAFPNEKSKKSRFRWGRVMEQVATSNDIPIIAQFVQEFNRPEVETSGRTLRAIYGEAYKDFERIIAKWNGDFLLVREPIWALMEDSLLSYLQALKIEAISAAEVKSLTELRDALCNLTEPQWKRVKKEYRALKPADPLRDMLMLTKKLPELLRSGGLVLDASLGEELQRRGYFAGHALMKPENATCVRFVLIDAGTPERPKVMVRLEAFAEKERDWIMVWAAIIAPPEKYD